MQGMDTPEIFIARVDATAGDCGAYVKGDRHALNVFVRASSNDEAVQVSEKVVGRNGWTEVKILRTGKLDPARLEKPEHVRAAAEAAQLGASIVVYRQVQ